MLRIRIVTASASAFAFLIVTLGCAAAQTATTGATGTPLPLLQFLQHKSTPKLKRAPKSTEKLAKNTPAKRRLARGTIAKAHHEAAAPQPQLSATSATAALPENIWPGANAEPPADASVASLASGNTASDALQTPAPHSTSPAVTTAPVVETNPNEILADGHTVQLSEPEKLNPIDLAADDGTHTTKTAEVAAPTDPAPPAPSAPTLHTMVASPIADPPSPVGSASWIAQVLAALGGAITAGVVAWFLIGPAPRRTYG